MDGKKNLELDKICRVCLAQKKDMRPIFGEMIAEMLMDCASVKIENTDGWPDKICIQCVHAVSRCHAFKTLVERSDIELREYIKSITIVIENFEPEDSQRLEVSSPQHHQQQHTHQHKTEMLSPTESENQTSTSANASSETNFQSQVQQRMQTSSMPQQIVLPNGQVINTTQIVSHNGQHMQILPAELSQLLQSGNTVQMIGQNGQTTQVLQLEQTSDDGCEIIMHPELVDDTQYFEDVTVTTHDDIETSEDVIHIQEDEEIFDEQTGTEEDDENCITLSEDISYQMETLSEEEEVEDEVVDEKAYLAEFISSQVSTPGPGRYVCNLCRKEFKQYKWMENHLKSHTNWIRANCKKQPQCEICQRSFKGPGMLRMHMKTHEVSEKIPTCSICNKQFKTKTILYRHRQIHQMRTYACGNCSKSFSSPLTLNTHMQKKHLHEDAIYKCAVCCYMFSALDMLKNHVQTSGHCGKSQDGEKHSS